MVRADQIGQDSGELLDVIGRSVVENRRLVVQELQHSLHWKMAAVAAISVIVELADGREVDQNVQVAIKAFKQAEDLLEVLDCPDNLAVDSINLFDTCRLEAYRLNLEAQNKMLKLENLARNGGQRYQASMQEVHQIVDWFRMPANNDPVGQRIPFYKDWTKQKFCFRNVHTAGEKKNSMECVCKVISRSRDYGTKEELINVAMGCLGDMIGACVELLPDVLLQHRVYWAREIEEDKCRKAVEIAAKLFGVRERWNPA
ncbi:hypothetical protein SUGI_0094380 [Cryptomeria japonica]|nr:hypothetical protein SUGI_0094380 [Cryptomeria japonica]